MFVTRLLCCSLAAAVLGCGDATEKPPSAPQPTASSVTLQVTVVNDEPLAAALVRLRGEWDVQGKGKFEVTSVTELPDRSATGTDIILFPARYFDSLCLAKQLQPVRKWVLDSQRVEFARLPRLVREHQVVWNRQVMALPLGAATPLCAIDGPLDEQITWEALAARGRMEWRLGGEFPYARALLARVASLALPEHGALEWFDEQSGNAVVDSPPFVTALESLVAESTGAGQVAAYLVLPSREASATPAATVAPLPTSDKYYDFGTGDWRSRDLRQAPAVLVGTHGMLAGVLAESRNAATAFAWMEWIGGSEILSELQNSSPSIVPLRRGDLDRGSDWLTGRTSSSAFARANYDALNVSRAFRLPAVEGIDKYLTVLDTAVRDALEGRAEPQQVLQEVADSWRILNRESASAP